jgi:hypothetical protein
LLGPIISRLFTCSNAEKNKLKNKTKGACSSPISMVQIHRESKHALSGHYMH